MNGRIIILSDNRTTDPRLQTEHGLSVYMESASGKYLLDTGASDLFIRNAGILGIDLAEVDYCLISHGHNDHTGGLPAFLAINRQAKVVLSAHIPGADYVSVCRHRHSLTCDLDFAMQPDRFVFIQEDTTIGHLHVYAQIARKHTMPSGDRDLLVRNSDGEYVSDTFRHELAFVADGILFTGCAHNGILNILETVKEPVKMSIGGFHLLDSNPGRQYESDGQLRSIASSLAQDHPDVSFHTGHCTGDHCFQILAKTNNNLHQFRCGEKIIIP